MSERMSIPEIRIKAIRSAVPIVEDSITNPYKAARLVGDKLLGDAAQECVLALPLDCKNRVVGVCTASMGGINASIAHPRELLKAAVATNAASLMLMHCHPSGEIDPSKQDLEITDKMQQLCNLMEIPLVDHIIVGCGTGKYYSFREKGQIHTALPNGIVADYAPLYAASAEKVKSEKVDKVKELTDSLLEGVKDYLSSDRYKDLLDTMSKFHHYSLNNCLLISLQKPSATQVASYQTWQSLGRTPKKGTGIKVVCPCPYKKTVQTEVIDKATGEKRLEDKEIQRTYYKVGHVFDVSDTVGKDLPTVAEELEGSVDNKILLDAIKDTRPAGIDYVIGRIDGESKGFFSERNSEIRVKEGMSDLQTLKTTIHEIVHSRYHQKAMLKDSGYDKADMEAQAEGTAYCVCKYFGIDTSDYSFPYVGGWTADTNKMMANLEAIKKYSKEMISDIEKHLAAVLSHTKAMQAISGTVKIVQDDQSCSHRHHR